MHLDKLGQIARRSMHPNHKLILLALADYSNTNGYAWPRITTLMAWTGLSRRSLFRSMGELESMGILVRRKQRNEAGKQQASTYKVVVQKLDAFELVRDVANREREALQVPEAVVDDEACDFDGDGLESDEYGDSDEISPSAKSDNSGVPNVESEGSGVPHRHPEPPSGVPHRHPLRVLKSLNTNSIKANTRDNCTNVQTTTLTINAAQAPDLCSLESSSEPSVPPDPPAPAVHVPVAIQQLEIAAEKMVDAAIETHPTIFSAYRNGADSRRRGIEACKSLITGKFLQQYRWDPLWLSGRMTVLEAVPGLTVGTESALAVIADSVAAYLAMPANDVTLTPPRGSKIALHEWIVSTRNPSGCRSPMVRYLLEDPRNPADAAWKAVKAGLPENVRGSGQTLLTEAYSGPLSPRMLLSYWTAVKDLVGWHTSNIERLLRIDVKGTLAMRSGPEHLIRLCYAFWEEYPAWFRVDRFMSPSHSSQWRAFTSWVQIMHDIELNPAAMTPAEADDKRIRYNAQQEQATLAEIKSRINRGMVEEYGEPADPAELERMAREVMAQEAAAKRRPIK